jgi:uncharacterized protein (DUF433 family)
MSQPKKIEENDPILHDDNIVYPPEKPFIEVMREKLEEFKEYLEATPQVLGGKPRLKGTRMGIHVLLDNLEDDACINVIVRHYPHLDTPESRDKIKAAIRYASCILSMKINPTLRKV